MPWQGRPQVNPTKINSSGSAARRATQEDGAGDTPRCATHLSETLRFLVDVVCAGVVTVSLGKDGTPLSRQQTYKFICQCGIAQRNVGRHNQRGGIIVQIQTMYTTGHHSQDTARTLEPRNRGPVRIQPLKDLRMNRVAFLHAGQVVLLGDALGIICPISGVHPDKGGTGFVSGYHVDDLAEQTAAHNLESLVDG